MLKTIIQPSMWMVNFLLLLHLRLSKPQRQHLLRLSEALVVCQEPHKTLAALHRQWVEAPNVSTDAHFRAATTVGAKSYAKENNRTFSPDLAGLVRNSRKLVVRVTLNVTCLKRRTMRFF